LGSLASISHEINHRSACFYPRAFRLALQALRKIETDILFGEHFVPNPTAVGDAVGWQRRRGSKRGGGRGFVNSAHQSCVLLPLLRLHYALAPWSLHLQPAAQRGQKPSGTR
jgi:hypothetical protein